MMVYWADPAQQGQLIDHELEFVIRGETTLVVSPHGPLWACNGSNRQGRVVFASQISTLYLDGPTCVVRVLGESRGGLQAPSGT